jgi:hypothetical protein
MNFSMPEMPEMPKIPEMPEMPNFASLFGGYGKKDEPEKHAKKPEEEKKDDCDDCDDKAEKKPEEKKPEEQKNVVHDDEGNDCYVAVDCVADSFVFGKDAGGDDQIKEFNGEEGDRIEICGDFKIIEEECQDVVIEWGDCLENSITLVGVTNIDNNWVS